MTSPTDPPKRSIRDRISRRLSTDSSGHYIDAEDRHTRNVTWLFVGLIVLVGAVVIVGLGYGFYESNLKPLASVDGSEVSRGDWQDRQRLQGFRLDRAESQVRSALASGAIGADLAKRRFDNIAAQRQAGAGAVMDELVDLIFKEKLAAGMGVSVTPDEVAAALAADGTAPEARRVEALIITSSEQQDGLPATPESRAGARTRAEEALGKLQAGATVADLVDEYSPSTAQVDGDIGYVSRGDINDPAWEDAIFAANEGDITPIVEASGGEQLIAVVSDIVEAAPDPGFLDAVNEAVGEGIHERNVAWETLADKLQERVTADAVDADYDQVELAEILIEGDTSADDEDTVRASHILYQPEAVDADGVAIAAADLPADDPAWAEAEALADAAAADLRAIDDVDARVEAFAERARTDGDDSTAANGGDLGFFSRQAMVPAFADAIFDASDPQHGDILGPVRSEFGWHVIMFDEAQAPLAERVAAVEAALAEPGADFRAVAAEFSDGPEALEGGNTGWQILDDLDDIVRLALTAVDVGDTTEPVDSPDGYTMYKKLDEASRPLDAVAAAQLARTAFPEWYAEQRSTAEDEGRISVDASVYE